jgi:hypothetical protein
MSRKLFYLGVIWLIAIIVISCGSKVEVKDVIGRWTVVKSHVVDPAAPGGVITDMCVGGGIDFLSDKSYLPFKNPKSPTPLISNGQWTILDDGRIKLLDIFGDSDFATIKDNQMVLSRRGDKFFLKKQIKK